MRVSIGGAYATWRQRWPRRVRLLVTLLTVAALGLYGYAISYVATHPAPALHVWLLGAAIVALTVVLLVPFSVGGNGVNFEFFEAGCMGLLSLMDARYALLLVPLCLVPWPRRRGITWVHRVHTSATRVIAFAVAAVTGQAVYVLAGGSSVLRGGLDGPRAAGLAAAGLTVAILTAVSVGVAVSFDSSTPLLQVLARNNGPRALVASGNIVLALGTLALLRFGRTEAILVPLALLLLLGIYRAYLRVREDRDTWRTVHAAADDLALLDEQDFLKAAVKRARELFYASTAELLVPGDPAVPNQPVRRYRSELGEAAGDVQCLPDDGTDPPGHVVRADLAGHDRVSGELRLAYRAARDLDERERMVLDTFCRTVGLGLDNARLHAEAVRSAEATAWAARHDPLTGLANRSLLRESLQRAIDQADPKAPSVAVILVNLDHFKQVNDTLGPAAGDLLLRDVAGRLVASTRKGDVVGRLVSDTFAVIATGLSDISAATRIAEHLIRRVSEEMNADGLRIVLEARAGVTCWPEDGTDADALITRAEQAARQSREIGQRIARYDASKDQSSVAQLSLVAELRDAIAHHEISLFFQPQVDTATGAVDVLEALARWEHPTRGLLAPDAFIPVVEQSGLIRDFTLEVIDQALAVAASWRTGGKPRAVSVNLSARNLLDLELPGQIAQVLDRHRVPPSMLILEITETVMVMTDLDVVEQVFAGLAELGVGLSVDDFGTGYSSLSFLLRWKVGELKIDREFVSKLLANEQARMLIVATVELAHGLKAKVVAEGVETQEEAAELMRIGVDRIQGYLYSRPVPASQVSKVIASLRPVGPALAPVIPMPFNRGR